MKKRLIASILILANVFSLASCNLFGNTDETDNSGIDIDDPHYTTSEKVYKAVNLVSEALAACDYDAFASYCADKPSKMKDAMPSLDEEALYDDDKENDPENELIIRHMIASTITSSIDVDSYEEKAKGNTCLIDVEFSYKDHNAILEKREKFVNTDDFKNLLNGVSDTVKVTVTMEFSLTKGGIVLNNPDDLTVVYDYKNTDLEYMKSLFDMVTDIRMLGDNWDPITDSYTDTDTFEILLTIEEPGEWFVWTYKYRVACETSPKWTDYYISEYITEVDPTEIHIKYVADDLFEEGFYCILFYNKFDGTIIGYEFDVYRSDSINATSSTTDVVASSETSESL